MIKFISHNFVTWPGWFKTSRLHAICTSTAFLTFDDCWNHEFPEIKIKHTKAGYYLVFESESEYIAFVLKWS